MAQSHDELVAMALKSHLFITEVEKRATAGLEGVGSLDLSGLAGADKSFEEAYSMVKNYSHVAAAEARVKASVFVEYVQSQGGSSFGKLELPGNIAFSQLQLQLPDCCSKAVAIGNKLSQFVSEQGSEFWVRLESASGSTTEFLSSVAPEVTQQAFAAVGVSSQEVEDIAKTGFKAISSLAPKSLPPLSSEMASVAGAAASAAAAVASPLVIDDVVDAAKSIVPAVSAAASAIASSASGLQVVAEGAAAVGSAVVNAISSINPDDVAQVASLALNVLGTSAAVFPFLLPLQIAMKDIGAAAKSATYNKEAANMLVKRCADCSLLVKEMAEKIDNLTKDPAEQEKMMKPFVTAIENCTAFLTKFTTKGFLRKMMSWNDDGRSLSRLDKEVSDTLQNLSMRIDGKQIDLQLANAEKMDALFEMVKRLSDGGSPKQASQLDPNLIAEIAKTAGCSSTAEISGELQEIGLKLDDIQKLLGAMSQKMQKMDDTLQNIDSKLDDEMRAQREANELLKAELLRQGAEQAQRHHITLEAMKSIAGGGKNIALRFSTTNQTETLSKRANEWMALQGIKVICLHPRGVGMSCFVSSDGKSGETGNKGQSFGAARQGRHGMNSQDGEDGDDGEDGEDGGDGTDGLNAVDAKDFEITIELLSEDVAKGTKTYKIEHSGLQGKDETTIDIDVSKTIFYVCGKGGNGGKGGDGGSGGNGGVGGKGGNGAKGDNRQDGGSGGCGGNGGSAGQGGLGGNGGHGSNGAKVVIHTNHSAVLQLFAIDVGAGKGGIPGQHGQSGIGGMGGEGGAGGLPDQWVETIESPQGKTSNSKSSRAGRIGKHGKKGKNGRPPPKKPSKCGNEGKPGSVSICIYDDTGLCESGGTPFRIEIDKKVYPKLLPSPLIYNVESTSENDPYIYGEHLTFGPVLPVNCGSLFCPSSSVIGRLTVHHKNAEIMSKMVAASFPKIPPENNTRNGELPQSAKQLLRLDLPSVGKSGFKLDGLAWPWVQHGHDGPRITSKFKFDFNIAGFHVRPTSEDTRCEGKYDVVLDIPIEVIKQRNAAVVAPASMAMSDAEIVVSYKIRNKLSCAPLVPSRITCQLNTAGLGFRPVVVAALDDRGAEVSSSPTNPAEQGFLRTTAKSAPPAIAATQAADMIYKLRLPPREGENNVQPGAVVLLRSEIFYQNDLAILSPVSCVRIAAPLPPHDRCSEWDVLVVSHSSMVVADYIAIHNFCGAFGIRASFLDAEHFGAGGKLLPETWSAQRGKVVMVHIPVDKTAGSLLTSDALMEHVRLGGGLVCGSQANFQLTSQQPWNQFRRAVVAGDGVTLTNLKNDLSINGSQLSGQCMKMLVANIICGFSTQTKLKFLVEKSQVCDLTIAGENLDFYQTQVDAGCCGCGGGIKIAPVNKTPCAIRDCVLASLRNDLRLDIEAFARSCNYNECISIAPLIAFVNQNITARPSVEFGRLARDLYAVMKSSNITDDKLFSAKAVSKAWLNYRPAIVVAANKCLSAGESNNLRDGASLAERICGFDIITSKTSQFSRFSKPISNFNSSSKLCISSLL